MTRLLTHATGWPLFATALFLAADWLRYADQSALHRFIMDVLS